MSTIKDKHICFTGKMEQGNRSEMKTEAIKLGAKIQSSVNSKTDYLVCGADVAANSKNTKILAAMKNKATILTEKSYNSLIAE
jgi:DNA ligase (NAD+)